MKYYLLAGEASGDLHGSNLIVSIKKYDSEARFRVWGGDLMQKAGGDLVVHYKERAFMGFIEVLFNLYTVFNFIKKCKRDIEAYQPDALIFIDNSGFNLRIAQWAKAEGFATHYYISPQVWASRAGRVQTIKKTIDQMYVILPFEKEFYAKYNYNVHFVGHPLLDAVAQYQNVDPEAFKQEHGLDDRPIIALLPGSRKQEVRMMLQTMVRLPKHYPDYQFIIAGAPSLETDFYQPFLQNSAITLIHNQTYAILNLSYAALVTSGTATLETALFKVPQVVCYKGSALSYQIAKRIIKLDYISLVNLILDKPAVKELIQNEYTFQKLKTELDKILDGYHRAVLFLDYYDLEQKLGGKGASDKTAQLIISHLNA